MEEYKQNKRVYHCGQQLKKPEKKQGIEETIVIVDMKECTIGTINQNGTIKEKITINSNIAKNQKKGGQSAQRYQRIRQEAIIWHYKRINELIKEIRQPIILHVSFVNKEKLKKYLTKENLKKIKEEHPCEYTGLAGLYQIANQRNKKQ